MRRIINVIVLMVAATSLVYSQEKIKGYENNWPQWRGPEANGIALKGNPPTEWSETKNVKWKIAIPGKGHNTPIVWGDQLFITTAVEKDPSNVPSTEPPKTGMNALKTDKVHKFEVLCIDRKNGKIIWEKVVDEEVPQEVTHELGSWASNSSVTDGKNLYAFFGSRGLYCLDFKGNVKWERKFLQMKIAGNFGEGASPSIYKDKVIVNWDHQGKSFITALDKESGKDIWKVDRDEGSTWATPLIVEFNGKVQIITAASKLVRSYDFETGELIWQCSGLTGNVIPCPVSANGIVYVMSGFRGFALRAIDLSKAKGDITDKDAILWKYDQDTPYTPSPMLANGKLYFLKANNGSLSCLDAKDGKVYYAIQKLEGIGDIYSSPTGVADRFYIVGEKGLTYVIKQGSQLDVIAKNTLDDGFHASPVIIGNDLYLRGFKNLYCISQK
jgi:outer membrane protein assembly factor BamB